MTKPGCELSVIIKTLNEGPNIARTLQHVLTAIEGLDAEVIVADSLSEDDTVSIALTFGVRVVQLLHARDRGCGVGAQLGYQFAAGRYLLVMDGDMDLQRAFVLAALARLHAQPRLAGVGGRIVDLNFDNIEYRARQARAPTDAMPGEVDRLNGGGMFRREAIAQVGYLTNRNLHACEELEQGLRLQAAGWRMERLPLDSVLHHGHTAPMWSLMRRRWVTRYAWGAGEMLRASLGQTWSSGAWRTQRHTLIVLAWWLTLLVLALLALAGGQRWAGWAVVGTLLLPPVLMWRRRRSLPLALYSVASWCLDTAGMLCGLVARQQEPTAAIEARVLVHTAGH